MVPKPPPYARYTSAASTANSANAAVCGRMKKQTLCTASMPGKARIRPSRSDSQAHSTRPPPLNRPRMPTRVAAVAPAIDCAASDACEISEMPHAVLREDRGEQVPLRDAQRLAEDVNPGAGDR